MELLALLFFTMSALIAAVVISHREHEVVEEVFPPPFVALGNPFRNTTFTFTSQLNRQLALLEYGLRYVGGTLDVPELKAIFAKIHDPRAVKAFRSVLVRYWWGYGLREASLTVKHINLTYRPLIFSDPLAKSTFGDAIVRALDGQSAGFELGRMSEDIVRAICEKYGVMYHRNFPLGRW